MRSERKRATSLFAALASVLLFGCAPGSSETGSTEKPPNTPILYVDAKAGADANHGHTPQAAEIV